eukprot:710143-Pelagomonas_calceolata.AAC.4
MLHGIEPDDRGKRAVSFLEGTSCARATPPSLTDLTRTYTHIHIHTYLQHPGHVLDALEANYTGGHDVLRCQRVQAVRGLIPQHVHVTGALQLRLVHACVQTKWMDAN